MSRHVKIYWRPQQAAASAIAAAAGAPVRPWHWTDDALCAEIDPEIFFPGEDESHLSAKLACARCPVRAQCLEYALEQNLEFGIYGGKSARARERLRRKQLRDRMETAS